MSLGSHMNKDKKCTAPHTKKINFILNVASNVLVLKVNYYCETIHLLTFVSEMLCLVNNELKCLLWLL